MSRQKCVWGTVLASSVLSVLLVPSAALAQYPLDATLCAAIGAAPPDYNARLGPNVPPAANTMQRKELSASCNDGSPAVMYMRPAPPGSPNADKWIIFLQGGGNCTSADECLERFCHSGASPEVFEIAGKMSSIGAPADAIDPPRGILAARPWNRFRDFNAVTVHYCSSDNWVGSSLSKTVTTSTLISYPIEFHGEAIVNDVLATLRSGPTFPDAGGEYAMPDLDDASLVLWSGESAGAAGARHHLDRVAAELGAVGVTVKGVMDAGYTPALSDPAIVWAAPNPYTSYADMGTNFLVPNFRTFWEADDTALDQSCLATGIDEWYCMDTVYTQINHITTPTFVRQDLTDFLAFERFFNWGIFTTEYDFGVATANQFALLPGGSGWFAPNCNGHVQIQTRGFELTEIRFGSGLAFEDVLWNWLRGAGLSQEIQADIAAGAPYARSLLCN